MTNLERILSMEKEELKQAIANHFGSYDVCEDCPACDFCNTARIESCRNSMIAWLESESE